jgi:pimeloyl-ACP methyl ester carboxylesterase
MFAITAVERGPATLERRRPALAGGRGHDAHNNVRTVVLVHSGFADASSWTPVVQALQSHNVAVLAPANPLRGLAADAEYIASFVRQVDRPVLLIGHSCGGSVVSVAGAAIDNVVGLVYVAAFILDEGESFGDVFARFPAAPLVGAIRPSTYPLPGDDAAVELTIASELYWSAFAADLRGSRPTCWRSCSGPSPRSRRSRAGRGVEDASLVGGGGHGRQCHPLPTLSDEMVDPRPLRRCRARRWAACRRPASRPSLVTRRAGKPRGKTQCPRRGTRRSCRGVTPPHGAFDRFGDGGRGSPRSEP